MALKKVLVDDIFYVMEFGKFKGFTVGEVFDKEPSYLVWAHETCGHFALSDDMYQQALVAKQEAYKKHWVIQSLEHGLTGEAIAHAFLKKFKEPLHDDLMYAAIYAMPQLAPSFADHVHTGGVVGGETSADETIPPWAEAIADKIDATIKKMGNNPTFEEVSKTYQQHIADATQVPQHLLIGKPKEDDKLDDDECPF